MIDLKRLREERHITQEEMAARLGISRSAVAMWENGQNMPPSKYLVALAEMLGCTTDELLGMKS